MSSQSSVSPDRVVGHPLVTNRPQHRQSASLHTEMVYSRIIHGYAPEKQGAILEAVSDLVLQRRMRPIATTRMEGLLPPTMKTAHQHLETGRTVGKIVITI